MVVFPAPFGPSSAQTWPSPRVKDTSSTAVRVPQTRVKARAWITVGFEPQGIAIVLRAQIEPAAGLRNHPTE